MNKARGMEFGKSGAAHSNPIAELTFSNTVMNFSVYFSAPLMLDLAF